MKKYLAIAFNWLKNIFAFTAIFFIFYFAWSNKEALIEIYLSTNLYLIIASISIWIFLHLISPIFTITSFAAFGTHLSYTKALSIHASQLPAKYIPGGIWHSVARSYKYNQEKISKKKISIYFAHEYVLITAITLFIGGLLLVTLSTTSFYVYLISSFSLLLIISWPLILRALPNKFQSDMIIKSYILTVLVMSVYWIIASTSFILFLESFSTLHLSYTATQTSGAYIFSWGVGFIAFFAPQGIGVSEFVISKILYSKNIELLTFMTLLVSYRIVILVADLLMWGISFFLKTITNTRTTDG